MRWVSLALSLPWLLSGCGSCGQGGTPPPHDVPPAPIHRYEFDPPVCEAGTLPQITDGDLAPAGLEDLLEASRLGSIAVAWDGAKAEVVTECHLEGVYQDVPDRKGRGSRLWLDSRILFRADEVGESCAHATHIVAAFAAAAPSSDAAGARRVLRAILVPLPCPSKEVSSGAVGCIGRGLTRAERDVRAQAVVNASESSGVADVRARIEGYALSPDSYLGLTFLRELARLPGHDGLSQHAAWIVSHYHLDDRVTPHTAQLVAPEERREPLPAPGWTIGPPHRVVSPPAFLGCFMELLDPAVDQEVTL